jgi:hypothetical protein
MSEFWWWLADNWDKLTGAVQNVVVAGAAIVTAIAAWKGLNTWRRQLRGGADFEVARRLAKATYKLRDELAFARSRYFRGYEFPTGYTETSPRAADRATAWAHVYAQRWKPVAEALQDFDAAVLESEALWGAGVRAAVDRLRACVRSVSVAMEAIVDNERNDGANFKLDVKFGKEMRYAANGSPNGDDSVSTDVRAAIEAIEAEVRPHLKR